MEVLKFKIFNIKYHRCVPFIRRIAYTRMIKLLNNKLFTIYSFDYYVFVLHSF